MSPWLAYEMESRGRDSWGCTNGREHIRHLGPVSKTWNESMPAWIDWPYGIFHTRAASTGAVTIDNQHPFIIDRDGVRIVGIHNGIVSNYDALNKKYSRTFDCDSPHIFMALAGFSPTNEVCGYGNVAWYEVDLENHDTTPELHFVRFNGDNLNIAALVSGEIVFASTPESIKKAAMWAGGEVRTFYQVQGDREYIVNVDEKDPDKHVLVEGRRLPFGNRTSYTEYPGHSGNYGINGNEEWMRGSGTGRSVIPIRSVTTYNSKKPPNISLIGSDDRRAGTCLASSCGMSVKTNRLNQVLCEVHFAEVEKIVNGWMAHQTTSQTGLVTV